MHRHENHGGRSRGSDGLAERQRFSRAPNLLRIRHEPGVHEELADVQVDIIHVVWFVERLEIPEICVKFGPIPQLN